MRKIIECVPNFSEGRDHAKIERLVECFKNQPGFKLISYEPDGDYNRTVVTLIGEVDPIMDALMIFVGRAIELIDMNHQSGQHPRIGAVDVIPFIPIENVTIEECVSYAEMLGERVAKTFDIPVFLYAQAAKKEDRISLPSIRKGEYEGMIEKIKEPEWAPDFGQPKTHPTFGSVAIGARDFLVAFNIDLATTDEKITASLARTIRQSSGGFQYIQAGPAFLETAGHMQVTMNILNHKKNPMYRIFETIKMEAKAHHVEVVSSEVIGLIPKAALLDSIHYYFLVEGKKKEPKMALADVVAWAERYLMIRDFSLEKIVEYWLED